MQRIERDEEREERIIMEIVVDAYGVEEQVMGWYYYLDETVRFPLTAICQEVQRRSPLKQGERVTVTGMADMDDCMREMTVEIELLGRTFSVPLAQLQPVDVDEATQQAIEDWHYWVKRGYELG